MECMGACGRMMWTGGRCLYVGEKVWQSICTYMHICIYTYMQTCIQVHECVRIHIYEMNFLSELHGMMLAVDCALATPSQMHLVSGPWRAIRKHTFTPRDFWILVSQDDESA